MLVHAHKHRLNFFKSPPLYIQIPSMLILSLVAGLIIFSNDVQGLVQTFFLLFIPTFLAAITMPLLKGYQEDINFGQSTLIAIVSLGVIIFLSLIYLNFSLSTKIILITVYAVPLSLRYLIIRTLFIAHVFKALPYAFFQSIIALPIIHYYYRINLLDIIYFFVISLIGLTSIVVFMAIVNRPFLRDFGISTMDMLRIAFQVLKGKEVGEVQLEDVFKKTAIKGDVKYTVFSFKSKRGSKGLFVVPCIHPGPIKGIAGSRLSEIVAEELEDKFGMTFTFHGPSTHVQNPIKEKDCKLLTEDIDKRFNDFKYSRKGTSFLTKYKQVAGGAQMFGDGLFLTASFSPKPTEDIDAPVGEIISLKAVNKGFLDMALVDTHNCIQRGALELYYPSRRYRSLMGVTNDLMNDVKELKKTDVKLGVAAKKGLKKSDGIGGEGIKAAVFEADGKKNAFILIDGNNMVQGLREAIQEEISDIIDVSEVMTSDSHEVNTLTKDYNPVGEVMDHNEIKDHVREVTERAISDLELVQMGVLTGELCNFSLMGPTGSHRLNAVAETIYQMVPLTLALTFAVQSLATTLIVLFL